MDKSSWPEALGKGVFPIARAGYSVILAAGFATLIFALLGFVIPSLAGLIVTLFVCFFFRDPDRIVPDLPDAIVSPADGRVIKAGPEENSDFFDGPCLKISIFMSVFNVHVNRVPHEGTVKKISYHPGAFFSANLDKASKRNEHNAVFLETSEGKSIGVVQIAGLIARRIICYAQKGDTLSCGQRFGLICFGSRVDVYLPADTRLHVVIGDRVKAGTSLLGSLP
ncbi:MAG: phosphatidylserine decarboxylase family protein [Desulfobacterales bacterium]|nr:phosphatidylserine decarboxylase family protein [Desulfobacterales bacterium]